MAEYRIEFEDRALRGLRRVPRADMERIMDKIRALASDPRPAGSTKMAGMVDAFRIRSGDYRVVYTVDDGDQVITVTKAGNRRDVYR